MPLSAGTRLGSYEILSALGAGGMGEVYRGRDTKLDRAVAIKILPEAFAADTQRIARFQREAKTLASLNHPNIAHIHGLEESNGVRALVMELVEGEDLAQRIARGAIPVAEALPIANQIADALDAAHEQGIIHRDLKPANIRVRPDGTVKVLDFGLAKAMEPTGVASPSVSQSPTITTPAMTQAGTILGTFAYMSPEQARGKPVDKRADIWAFGCVLYEALTGRAAFAANTVSDTIARIIEREPDWQALPDSLPVKVRDLLRRCLQKDPRRRLHDIADARLEIEDALTGAAVSSAPVTAQRKIREWVAWTLLVVAVVALAALTIPTSYFRRAVPQLDIKSLDVVIPPTSDPFSFALSPDGRQLASVATGEGRPRLWLRPLEIDQAGAQPLAGTEGASYPFWQPDGRAIGFFADGKLKKLDLAGGTPQVLADAPAGRGGTWNRDGVIVFAPAPYGGLMRVMATGGTPATRLLDGKGGPRWPQFLPDGRRVLFFLVAGQLQAQGMYVISLDGGEPTRVLKTEAAAAYAPPGYLLRVSQGVLVAQRFDSVRATVAGEPIPVAQPVGADDGTYRSGFSVSATGVLAHRTGAAARRQLIWVERTGKVLGTIGPPDEGVPASPELSPNGQSVATFRQVQRNADVWVTDTAPGGVPSRITFGIGDERWPVWSPDGSRVAFALTRKDVRDLFEKSVRGTAEERPLLVSPLDKTPLDWSRDGVLLFSTQDPKTGSDLWALQLTGESKRFPVVQTSFEDMQGQFSPDGRWLAYASNKSGQYEIYVQPFPGSGGEWQVSTAGGTQPRWKRDGHELFYVAPDNKLMAVPIRSASNARGLDTGTPDELFQKRLASGAGITPGGFDSRAQYAVAQDGRFLLNVDATDAVTLPITVLLNWTAGLKE